MIEYADQGIVPPFSFVHYAKNDAYIPKGLLATKLQEYKAEYLKINEQF